MVRAAVAPFNGYITDARVRAGDLVRKGQVLCTLDDRELNLERLKWLSQREQLVKQYSQAMAKREAAQVEILTAQINQAKADAGGVNGSLASRDPATKAMLKEMSDNRKHYLLNLPLRKGTTPLQHAPEYEEWLIEAMRHGIPIIASVHDAGHEVNADGQTGFNIDVDR